MKRKTKSEILLKLVQLLKSRGYNKKNYMDYIDGFMDALEWTLSLKKQKTVSITEINQQIAKEINEHSKRK